jgi:Predicted nucleotide-binding protein containing TIR-like domain
MSKVTIFYSWQSDLPKKTNANLIRKAIRSSSSNVESIFENNDVCVVHEEATRDTPGSPNIPLTILKKIEKSDIFICDITTINKDSIKRKMPNPNVVFELGYAVSILGWNRVIMLFNLHYGTFPNDLPFDFGEHRVSKYNFSLESKQSDDIPLQKTLSEAIELIVKTNPEKKVDLLRCSPEQKMRSRDVENINWIMSQIHIPKLDALLQDAPKRLSHKMFIFWEGFNGVINNSLFHLYDKKLKNLFNKLHVHWGKCVSFPDNYITGNNNDYHVFANSIDPSTRMNDKKIRTQIGNSAKELHATLGKILKYLRLNYIEVDIDNLSSSAYDRYIDFNKNANLSRSV